MRVSKSKRKEATQHTQESLLNFSIQSWNNYYNLSSLPQGLPIIILPSDSKNPRRLHMQYYYQVITVEEALKQGFFQNNCKCKFEILER